MTELRSSIHTMLTTESSMEFHFGVVVVCVLGGQKDGGLNPRSSVPLVMTRISIRFVTILRSRTSYFFYDKNNYIGKCSHQSTQNHCHIQKRVVKNNVQSMFLT